MLVSCLTLEKPIMRASDMFTVGVPLIPTLVSNIVTYVLVALQMDQNRRHKTHL
ncbi:unnamed protein product [Acanthoscelides obtectus]|nr:unnamed protein product [Acanthoscelides obtectus]CAK1653764.1 hypothetical protein AOBTE_LOCUS18355 [Acanthoscelides obtectus]